MPWQQTASLASQVERTWGGMTICDRYALIRSPVGANVAGTGISTSVSSLSAPTKPGASRVRTLALGMNGPRIQRPGPIESAPRTRIPTSRNEARLAGAHGQCRVVAGGGAAGAIVAGGDAQPGWTAARG